MCLRKPRLRLGLSSVRISYLRMDLVNAIRRWNLQKRKVNMRTSATSTTSRLISFDPKRSEFFLKSRRQQQKQQQQFLRKLKIIRSSKFEFKSKNKNASCII